MTVTAASAVSTKHPVDQVPPLARLAPLGLQHVLAMYAGAVAVPLVVGSALISAGKLAPGDLPYLISADLLVAGIATLIQSLGFWRFGVRLPLMQGCTFAAVSPMIAIGSQYGVTAIYGSVIAAGLLMMLLAPVFATLLRFFPPLVTGTVILIIGLSLMAVAAGWVGGGTGSDNFGAPINVAFAALTLLIILAIERFAPPALQRLSILLGLVLGTLISIPFRLADFSGVAEQSWIGVSTPFHFGLPTFQVSAIVAMSIVALVIMTETTGDMLAIGEIVDKPVKPRQLADGLRADGLSTLLGGVFNTFPYTAFAQNVGLVSLRGSSRGTSPPSRVRCWSSWACCPNWAGSWRGFLRVSSVEPGSRCSGWSPPAACAPWRGCGSTTPTCWWWPSPWGSACCPRCRPSSTPSSRRGSRSSSTPASRPGRSPPSC